MRTKLLLIIALSVFTIGSNAQKCLVAQYLFSGNANDNIGNNNGTVTGAILCPDRFNNANSAYNFDGTGNTYIQIPSTGLTNNQYSYSLWVNLNSLPASGNIGFMLSIGSSSSNIGQSLNIQNQYLSTTNTWGGGGYNTTTPNYGLQTSNVASTGKWYHIASVRGSNYAKLYVNGVKVDSIGTVGALIPDYSNATAKIGIRANGTSPVDAKIDDIGIYSCALSNKQVDSLYKAQSLNNCLIAQYLFSGNANDNIGNNNGTVTGATLCPDRFNNANSAYNFDGTGNTYIQIPSTGLTNNQYSYSLWVNLNSLPASGNIGFMLSIGSSSSNIGQSLNIQNQYLSTTNTWGGGGYNTTTPNYGLQTSNVALTGKWYHIVSVRGSNYAKLYVNGVKVDSVGTVGTLIPDYDDATAKIGIRSNGTSPVNAKIDDIGIYSCALSTSKVDSIYNAQRPTGIEQADINNQFFIYPNPTRNSFVVEITLSQMGRQTMQVFDITGNLMFAQNLQSEKTSIDPINLPQGVYNVCIKSNESVVNKRLIILK